MLSRFCFFFSSRRRHTRLQGDWSSDVCSSDLECDDRYTKTFVACTDVERAAVLDDIAWPRKAKPEHMAGVAFFNSFRDFTASGFFSSRVGIQDLRYIGNTFVAEWKGCPPEALVKLGVHYE